MISSETARANRDGQSLLTSSCFPLYLFQNGIDSLFPGLRIFITTLRRPCRQLEPSTFWPLIGLWSRTGTRTAVTVLKINSYWILCICDLNRGSRIQPCFLILYFFWGLHTHSDLISALLKYTPFGFSCLGRRNLVDQFSQLFPHSENMVYTTKRCPFLLMKEGLFSFLEYLPVLIDILETYSYSGWFSRAMLISINMLNLIYLRNLQESVSTAMMEKQILCPSPLRAFWPLRHRWERMYEERLPIGLRLAIWPWN